MNLSVEIGPSAPAVNSARGFGRGPFPGGTESLERSDQSHRTPEACLPQGRPPMLNNIGLPGLLLIAIVVLVLFGRGKISSLMGEVGKGITAFKKGVDDGKKEIEDQAAEVARDVTPETSKDKV
jgi:sec-independent protein translocase protein TatA